MQGAAGLLPYVILVMAFYFLLIKPQQVRARKQREMVEALSFGDRVITVGGLHGTVIQVTDATVVLRVFDNSELEFEKAAIGRITTDIPPLDEPEPDAAEAGDAD